VESTIQKKEEQRKIKQAKDDKRSNIKEKIESFFGWVFIIFVVLLIMYANFK